MYNIFGHIGFMGPNILFIATITSLYYYSSNYIIYYLFFYFLNKILNTVLKNIFKEPRPKNQRHVYNFEKKIKLGQQYGMPSGHAQSCFYSLITNYYFSNKIMTYISILISIITLIQRYVYKNHTIKQLISGSITGIVFFYITYYIYRKRTDIINLIY